MNEWINESVYQSTNLITRIFSDTASTKTNIELGRPGNTEVNNTEKMSKETKNENVC